MSIRVYPILAIFGASVAVVLHKKIKDFVLLVAVLFFAIAFCRHTLSITAKRIEIKLLETNGEAEKRIYAVDLY